MPGPSPAASAHLEVPGARLWYTDSGGCGAPVVFLHAGFAHAEFFERHQLPAFVAAGRRFVSYDRRGHGRSIVEPGGRRNAAAADDLQALANHLRLEHFDLVGTAAGGIVALDYALGFRQRLRHLVVANSVCGVQDADYVALCKRLRPPEFERLPTWLKELGPEYRATDAEGTALWRDLETRSLPHGPVAPLPTRHRITFAALEGLDVPTLVLTGDADLYSPPATMKRVADRLPNARFARLPAVGHAAFWEAPETFNRLVLDFLG